MGPESSRRRALHGIRCSFCGKPRDQVAAIVAGPTPQIAICNECIELCREIITEQTDSEPTPPPAAA